MDNKTFEDILKLNQDFYESVAESFDRSRSKPWTGWKTVLDFANQIFAAALKNSDKTPVQIIDLGCGNGRFFEYLQENALFNFSYIGYDISHKLLSLAKNKYKHTKALFLDLDIIKHTEQLPTADVICAFGVTHHIPDNNYRKVWFENIANRINPQGIFVYSTWNFTKTDKSSLSNLVSEKNDKMYSWQNSNNLRYVHIYDPEEISNINTILGREMKQEKTFQADGKDNLQNNYYIWQKTSRENKI